MLIVMVMKIHTTKERPWAGSLTLLKPSTKAHFQTLRKLWHAGMILMIIFLYAFVFTDRASALSVLLLIGGPFVFLDASRLKYKSLNKFIISIFGPLMRKRELMTLSATSPVILATFILIAFFPKHIVLLSLMCLGLGDVAASMIGLKFGKDKMSNGKSLQGSFACFVVCFLLTLFFLIVYQVSTQYAFLICFLGGLVPTLGELLASKNVDDNFSIPILTACIMHPILLFFSTF